MEKELKSVFSLQLKRLTLVRIDRLAHKAGLSKNEFIRQIIDAELSRIDPEMRSIDRDQLSPDPLDSL